jgi:hypothetical protein
LPLRGLCVKIYRFSLTIKAQSRSEGLAMLKIRGRTNSINVQKVLWCCGKLSIEYERIDAGLQFGVNTTPDE